MHAHLSETEILIIENIIAMETPETVSMGRKQQTFIIAIGMGQVGE